MPKQWVGFGILVICIASAPFLANTLWRRGHARPLGYVAGLGLLFVGALMMKVLGGFPDALR